MECLLSSVARPCPTVAPTSSAAPGCALGCCLPHDAPSEAREVHACAELRPFPPAWTPEHVIEPQADSGSVKAGDKHRLFQPQPSPRPEGELGLMCVRVFPAASKITLQVSLPPLASLEEGPCVSQHSVSATPTCPSPC